MALLPPPAYPASLLLEAAAKLVLFEEDKNLAVEREEPELEIPAAEATVVEEEAGEDAAAELLDSPNGLWDIIPCPCP